VSKRVVILGSTGSIGESALRVIRALPGTFRITGLAARREGAKVLAQAAEFGVRDVAIADPESAGRCRAAAPADVRVHEGEAGLTHLAGDVEADIVLCSVVGMAGLKPVLAALRARRDVALATKEVLVAAGAIVTREAARFGARLLPVDSEHSALFQCLAGSRGAGDVQRLILTASGGPFAANDKIDFDSVTVKEALRHPSWNMGRKVTIDSATLMNKGLEVMEARWLFDIPIPKIDVVVHPESIVHSLVEFLDGSVLAQLSLPDMRFAIQYALTWPERRDGALPRLDLATIGRLHFRAPDENRFPCLRLAREAALRGGTAPTVLNAANEVAVAKFLEGGMRFSGIWRLVEDVMARHRPMADPGLDDILAADADARRAAQAWAG